MQKPGSPPLLILASEPGRFWLPTPNCSLNPNLGVGVRFPVRAGLRWPGLKDVGTQATVTVPTSGQEHTRAVSGVGGGSGLPAWPRALSRQVGRGRGVEAGARVPRGSAGGITSDMVMFQFVSKADRLLSKPDLQT